jgi:hypothetical protein
VVGPDQQQFYLHLALVSDLSKPLDDMMNNQHMEESLDRTAYLKQTNAQTFALFAEFAYAGNYRSITTSSRILPVISPAKRKIATILSNDTSLYAGSAFINRNTPEAYAKVKKYMQEHGKEGCCRYHVKPNSLKKIIQALIFHTALSNAVAIPTLETPGVLCKL